MSPAIFFGIGAQKAGTSWLYEVLSAHPDCKPLPVKELHFFDRKYAPTRSGADYVLPDVRRLAAAVQKLEARIVAELRKEATPIYQDGFLAGVGVQARADQIVRIAERLTITDTGSYVRYVERWRKRWPKKVIGEITPAYSILPEEGMRELASLYPAARFIFLMRDPLSRLWSHIRFSCHQRGLDTDPNTEVAFALGEDSFRLRSDYARTIRLLETIVPAERIHYAFFEEMVDPATVVREINRVEAFLGLTALANDTILDMVGKPANVAPSAPMIPATRDALLDLLRPQYAFVAQHFGRLPRAWEQIA